MGFADYLSRHPNSPPPGENMNKNHVINIITALKYALFTKQRISANQKARQISAQNEVKNHSNWSEQKQRAFCHYQANKQTKKTTFRHNTIPITRRHRAPNKNKMDSTTGYTTNNTNTIATRTEDTNNTGQRLDDIKTFQPLLALSKTRLRSNTIWMHPIRWQIIYTDSATQTRHERNTQEKSRTNRDDAYCEFNLVPTHPQGNRYAYSKLPTMHEDR